MRVIFLIIFLLPAIALKSQVPADAQKQLKEAQKRLEQMKSDPRVKNALQMQKDELEKLKMDKNVQEQLARAQKMLDSAKQDNPSLANVQIPNTNNIPGPNLDSFSMVLNQVSDKFAEASQTLDKSIPQKNLLRHIDKIMPLDGKSLIAKVNATLNKISPTLGPVALSNLKAIVNDKKVNVSSIGSLLLTTDGDENAALYLICHAVLINPGDPWAINSLGTYYRYKNELQDALQCFLYAINLVETDSIINTNIGWAAAYYGDFDAAKKYFQKAITNNNDHFSKAFDGLATLYYAERDWKNLWQVLARQVKSFHIKPKKLADDLSESTAMICGTAAALTMGNLDKQSVNPNDDHTFDNPDPLSGHSTDPPPGAFVEDIIYPRYGKTFVNHPKQIPTAISDYAKEAIKTSKVLKDGTEHIQREHQGLKPLGHTAFVDENKNLVFPVNCTKYVNMLTAIDISFDKRIAWYKTIFITTMDSLRPKIFNRDNDLAKQYLATLEATCKGFTGDDAAICKQSVDCQWIPKMYASKDNDLEVVAKIWNDYYQDMRVHLSSAGCTTHNGIST